VGANATPDDVRLAGVDFIAVLEGRAAVVGPGHLPKTGMALHSLHAKPGMEALLVFSEIADELSHRIAEVALLLRTQLIQSRQNDARTSRVGIERLRALV